MKKTYNPNFTKVKPSLKQSTIISGAFTAPKAKENVKK